MRISDWSSDVCSSDLMPARSCSPMPVHRSLQQRICNARIAIMALPVPTTRGCNSQHASLAGQMGMRSEEHTSELQSLMRISYAVFCLKKKKQNRKEE